MKKFTKIVSLLTASALLALLPDSHTLTVSADEPETFCIAYVEEEDEWFYQEGASFDAEEDYDELDELEEDIENGDYVVIYGDSDHYTTFRIDAYLGNLTLIGGEKANVIYANGIHELHATYGVVAAITGDVENAYVYDDSKISFNNNVNRLEIISDNNAKVTCAGTVGYAICHYDGDVEFEIYNVAADKFRVDDSALGILEEYYSTTPSNTTATPAAPQTNNTSSSDEYDDVPKTGESSVAYLLFAAAAICFAGSRALKRA